MFLLFLFWLLLCVVQTVAALPWVATLDSRAITALRRPQVIGIVLACNIAAALFAAFTIANHPDTLMQWGRGYMAALHLQFAADFFIALFVVMLQVWPKGGAVALAAFRESVRQWMFVLLAVLGPFLMALFVILPYFTFGEDLKMVKELGYDLLVMLGSIFVVICASTSISDEIEGRTAVTLMSKPVSRRQFLLGKFAGILAAGTVLVVLLGWFVVWMFIYKEFDEQRAQPQTQRPADPAWVLDLSARYAPEGPAYDIVRGICLWIDEAGAIFPGLVIVSCQVMVLLAIAVALATRLHFTITFLVCAGFYFLGHLAPVLTAVSYNRMPLVKFMAGVFDVFMPGLEHFDMSGAVVRDTPLPPWDFAVYTANVALYAVTYSVIALLFGLILFEDKDLA
jgi:hypothetical protein